MDNEEMDVTSTEATVDSSSDVEQTAPDTSAEEQLNTEGEKPEKGSAYDREEQQTGGGQGVVARDAIRIGQRNKTGRDTAAYVLADLLMQIAVEGL